MIEFLDLKSQYQGLKGEIDSVVLRLLSEGSFIKGPEVKSFEEEFAAFQETDYCIGVANGTDALEVIIEALDYPEGSEILVPANTFIATAEAVVRNRCKPVFCDIDPKSFLLDLNSVRSLITDKTRAILAVHLYGHPADMDGLLALSKGRNIDIIEDAAQAHGALFKGKKVGGIGRASAFSFYPGKNLGAAGDGGAILTNDAALASKCRMLADHGRTEKYTHRFVGRNSRLDNLQAAILSIKLKNLAGWVSKRREIASFYRNGLNRIEGLVLPLEESWAESSYHLFVIRLKDLKERESLQNHLRERGVASGIHYPLALPKQPAFLALGQQKNAPLACEMGDQILSLPIGEHLNVTQCEHVVAAVRSFFDTGKRADR